MNKLLLFCLLLFLSPSQGQAQSTSWSREIPMGVMDIDTDDAGKYFAVASKGKILYFFNETGGLLWKGEVELQLHSIALSPKGEFVVAGDEYYIYSFNKSGNLTWKYSIGDTVRDIAISSEGYVVAGSSDEYVYFLRNNGSVLWRYKGDSSILAVDISPNGDRVAAGSSSGAVYILDGSGSLLQQHNIGRYVKSLSFLGDNVVTGSRFVRMLDQGGERWFYVPQGDVNRVDFARTNERVILSDEDGIIYVLNSVGNLVKKYEPGRGGLVIATTIDGYRIAAATSEEAFLFVTEEAGTYYVNFTSPRPKERISGVVSINATIDYPYQTLVVRIDGNYACGSLPCNWDTSAAKEGMHNITLVLLSDEKDSIEATIDVIVERRVISLPTNKTSEIRETLSNFSKLKNQSNYTQVIEKTKEIKGRLDLDRIKKLVILGIAILILLWVIIKVIKLRWTSRYRWRGR
jgi:WD40 repeat protein